MLISIHKASRKIITISMIVLLVSLSLIIPTNAQAQNNTILDNTCTYNEAVVGLCDLTRSVFFIELLPGDGQADWFTTYGETDYACQRQGFDTILCVPITFDRPDNNTSCINYPTFRVCIPDEVTDDPIIVVVEGGVDCIVNEAGNISCKPGTAPASPPVPALVPSFTG